MQPQNSFFAALETLTAKPDLPSDSQKQWDISSACTSLRATYATLARLSIVWD